MTRMWGKLAAACTLWLGVSASGAWAGSVTQPGETVGIAAGAPLPEGLYFVNTADWGCRNTKPETTCVGVDIPVIAWATPWHFLNARVQFLVATPAIEVGVHRTSHLASMYNPLFAGQLAWDLGNGFGFSYLLGAYVDVNAELAWSSTSINQRFALSYTGNNWNITANVIWGIHLDSVTNRPQISPCPAPLGNLGCNPDFLNVDLTVVKKLGQWQLGPVAFGSTDLNSPVAGYQKQSQIAVGGLLGYDFGTITLQGYATTDVHQRNYGGRDTRVWGRVIIPVWTPPAVAVRPLVTKG
jgi:hypothetical protein